MALRLAALLAPLLVGAVGMAPIGGAWAEADGQQAYEARDYAQAHALWLEAARRGEASAALGLGLLYDLGQGVPQDFAKALRWYIVAGDLGLPEAEFNVAVMNDSGRGTPRDAAVAATWYARAAANGNHRAEYDLGQLYAAGDGVPRNGDIANAWFAAASAGGLGAASARLATPPAAPSATAATTPVTLVAPRDDATVQRTLGDPAVELVWTAPSQPGGIRFYVELVGLGTSDAAPVFSGYTRASALSARVPGPGAYAWRVYAVSTGARSYAPTAWERFRVARPRPPVDADRIARATQD